MKNRKTFIGIAVLIAVLLLGIAYADVASNYLYIKGTASATTNDANFKVKFIDETTEGAVTTTVPTGVATAKVEALVTDDTNATIKVEGLNTKDQVATATYTIKNESSDIAASVTATATNTNTTWFEVTQSIDEAVTIEPGKETTITVTVKLKDTPATTTDVTAAVENSINVTITAAPVAQTQQPAA